MVSITFMPSNFSLNENSKKCASTYSILFYSIHEPFFHLNVLY